MIGNVEIVLQDVQVTDEGYDEAWAAVLDAFDNKREIVKAHFWNLMNLNKLESKHGIPQLLQECNAIIED